MVDAVVVEIRRFHSLTWEKEGFECNGDLSRTKLVDRANTQLLHMVVEALYAHRPGKQEELNSIKDCPSMRLYYAI